MSKSVYSGFLDEVKTKIAQAQAQALKTVNKGLISLYWEIGKGIVEKQNEYGWGKSIVENLATDLQKSFSNLNGFSSGNLWRMRKFYLTYHKDKILAPMVREISWSHNILIFERLSNQQEREFYIKMSKKFGWSKNILMHQIEGGAFEKFLLNQTNFDKAVPQKYRHQAKIAVKDEYTFDFLELSEEYDERELELSLIKNVRNFLLEMGADFTFIGNQYKIQVGQDLFYIDLLLYHRKLKSLIAIELKTGKFKPEYAGKMQFYLTALNETVKHQNENPSIGIIICKEKDRTVVEFALKESTTPIGVAQYSIKKFLPKEMRKLLPSANDIAESLKKLEE